MRAKGRARQGEHQTSEPLVPGHDDRRVEAEVGAELLGVGALLGRAGEADDAARAEMLRQLDSEAADAARGGRDDDGLSVLTRATSRSISIAVVPATPSPQATSGGVSGGSGTTPYAAATANSAYPPEASAPTKAKTGVPARRSVDPVSERLDGPRDLASGRVRKRRRERVDVAAAPHHVGEVDRCGLDADQDLAGARLGRRDVVEGEHVGRTGRVCAGQRSSEREVGDERTRAAALPSDELSPLWEDTLSKESVRPVRGRRPPPPGIPLRGQPEELVQALDAALAVPGSTRAQRHRIVSELAASASRRRSPGRRSRGGGALLPAGGAGGERRGQLQRVRVLRLGERDVP